MNDLTLFGHPFSSYTWKALIALYEAELPFDFRVVAQDDPNVYADLVAHWSLGKFPVLVHGDQTLIESSIIIEHLQQHFATPAFIPDDRDTALRVRFMDRVFDNYIMNAAQPTVNEHLLNPENPDQSRIASAKAAVAKCYDWLEANIGDEWAVGRAFTLADISAAPSLFYADWVEPISPTRPRLSAYRARLLARPSIAKAVDGARPYRKFFPPGAPDRD